MDPTAAQPAGVVSAGSTVQATDMIVDLRTSYLLPAKPMSQFVAQPVESLVAAFPSVNLFTLFTSACRCITFPEQHDTSTYSDPSISARRLLSPVQPKTHSPSYLRRHRRWVVDRYCSRRHYQALLDPQEIGHTSQL